MSAGIGYPITLDGVDLTIYPSDVNFEPQISQQFTETSNGKTLAFSPFILDGYPNVADTFADIALPYPDMAAADQTTIDILDKLAASGTDHTIAFWKKRYEVWTGKVGQQVYYLPRKNGPTVLSKSTTTFPVVFTINGVAQTVSYQAVVTAASSVPADTVWIPNNGTLFKSGNALGSAVECVLTYFPVLKVRVVGVATRINKKGVESKYLTLREIHDA